MLPWAKDQAAPNPFTKSPGYTRLASSWERAWLARKWTYRKTSFRSRETSSRRRSVCLCSLDRSKSVVVFNIQTPVFFLFFFFKRICFDIKYNDLRTYISFSLISISHGMNILRSSWNRNTHLKKKLKNPAMNFWDENTSAARPTSKINILCIADFWGSKTRFQ